MVIVQLIGGLGNQLYEYAFGKKLALRLNTELKLTLSKLSQDSRSHTKYKLDDFNIEAEIATPEEINYVKENGIIPNTLAEFENTQCTNVFIQGIWMFAHVYYRNISSLLRKEFTFNKPLSVNAETWKQKILSAECSVSMHFRRGDYIYSPTRSSTSWGYTLPFEYYYTCIDILKQKYNNLTVFVFSDTIKSIKNDIHLDVPVEFVEGCKTDTEEFILMSLCKHNITANSTFSQWAAWLNSNPEKKYFKAIKSTNEGVQQYLSSLTPTRKDSLLSQRIIQVPFDFNNQPEIAMPPFFSLVLVVNNDVATIADTLDSLLSQDYKYYEVIIIDNASTDGSRAICRQKIEGKKNVTFKKLHSKENNAKAWNMALRMARGKYVSFLKGNDRFFSKGMSNVYGLNEYKVADIIHLFSWLEENDTGNITFADKKFAIQCDLFKKNNLINTKGLEVSKLLLNQQINSFLGTKFFNRDFLMENKIKFDKQLDNPEAELFFQLEAFFKSKNLLYVSNALYIAPNKSSTEEGI